MRAQYILVIFLWMLLLAMAGSTYADVIYLKGGRTIEGKIIRQDEKKIWIITVSGTKIGIDTTDIEQIVPKDFVVKEQSAVKESGQASQQKKPGKTTYGTVTAEIAYTKGKKPGTQGESTDNFTVDGLGFSLSKYRDGKLVTFQRQIYKTGGLKAEVRLEGGVRQGIYRSFYEDGALKETGLYANGKRRGVFKQYWPSGKLKAEVLYRDDKEHGPARFYHKNGLLAREVTYADGKKDGLEKSYYETGQLETVQMYINGKAIGVTEKYYPSGQIKAKVSIAKGETTEYFRDGNIKSKLFSLENQYIEYDQDGNVLYKGQIPEKKRLPSDTDGSQASAGE